MKVFSAVLIEKHFIIVHLCLLSRRCYAPVPVSASLPLSLSVCLPVSPSVSHSL